MDEITFRVKKTPVAVVPKVLLDAPRLSLAAKGLWAYLEVHPELEAEGIEVEALVQVGVGEAAEIERCLNELLQAGYLEIR